MKGRKKGLKTTRLSIKTGIKAGVRVYGYSLG